METPREETDIQPTTINRRDALMRIFSIGIGVGTAAIGIITATSCTKDGKNQQKPPNIENQTANPKVKPKYPGTIFEEPETIEDLNSGTVLVLLGSNWCGQCIQAGRFLQQHEGTFRKNEIKTYECYEDLGIQPHKEWSPLAKELMKKYEIDGIPTVLIFSSGKLLQKFVGTNYWEKNNITELPTWIEANIKKTEPEKK